MNSARGSCRLRSWATPFRGCRGRLVAPRCWPIWSARARRPIGKASRRRHHLRRFGPDGPD